MKKAFTMIEVIIVIVILGILSLISSELILNIYANYVHTRSVNELEYKTDMVLEQIAKRLNYRLKGSEIAREIGSSEDDYTDLILSIKDDSADPEKRYALEWIGKSYETQNLVPNSGWTGVADLTSFDKIDKTNNTTSFISPGSKFNGDFENVLKGTIKNNKIDFGIYFLEQDPIFKIKTDFGYISAKPEHNKIAIFKKINNDENLTIEIPKEMKQVSDLYYLLHSAYAVVPGKSKDHGIYKDKNDTKAADRKKEYKEDVFDLFLYHKYQPWQGEIYKEGYKSLLAQNVSLFRFTQTQSGVIVIKLCMRTLDNDKVDFAVCKTKAVY